MEIGIGLGITRFPGWGVMNIGQLFASGEQGAFYDPSDMSTLFQDSEGTVPVTAVEQPVGRILDKSGRGNHATQATTPKRPIYSRRVNLLTKTEQFDDAVWVKSGLGAGSAPSVTPNAALAPDGTLTADQVTLAIGGSTSSSDWSWLYQNLPRTAGVSENFAIWVKAATPADIGRAVVLIGVSAALVTLSAEWVRYELPAFVAVSATYSYGVRLRGNETPGATDVSFHLWGASITLATDAHLPYQRVNTATDYDADPAKFPAYLRFDGVDDALETGNIDFTGTDKMTVWAGALKSDAETGAQYVAYSNGDNVNGFAVYAASNRWIGYSSGTTGFATGVDPLSIANTQNSVLAVSADQIAPYVRLRRDYQQVAESTAAQGGDGYGNRPLYIGAKWGTSVYFNGRLYSLIVRGAQSSLSQIEATELYMKKKVGIA